LQIAEDNGANVQTGCRVESVVIDGSKAIGVNVKRGMRSEFCSADLVILAAGGFGTPCILENSGIPCDSRLFVDPVLCVGVKWEKAFQNKELSMPFVVQREDYILSPYFDYLSYFFNKDWSFSAQDTLGMMVKLADTTEGSVSKKQIKKALNDRDKERLRDGVDLCCEIFGSFGVRKEDTILGTVNAGHPGGMLPLTAADASTLHSKRLPENLYVADATLFPKSLGNPPILTIMALAKRISKMCMQN
jgi:choline dehydrogenase-like flavoprotein